MTVSKEQLAEWAFDDEIMSLAWDKKRYSKSRYDDINNQEVFDENPAPYLLKPQKSNGVGVLLIHGLLASPAELRGYAEALLKQGYTVLGVRLKGHGTSPYDLRKQTFEDWYKSVKRSMEILRIYCDSMVVIGFSAGGGLALKLAAEYKSIIDAVVVVAVPVKFVDKSFLFVPLIHGTNRLIKWVSSIEGVKPFMENSPEHKAINYRNIPIKSLHELKRLLDEVEQKLPEIKMPVLVIYADEDHVVHLNSADIIMSNLGSECKKLITIHSERHGILMENIGSTWESINVFLEKNVLSKV
jgi:esterase/lipase